MKYAVEMGSVAMIRIYIYTHQASYDWFRHSNLDGMAGYIDT
jgi:hypothetical protein